MPTLAQLLAVSTTGQSASTTAGSQIEPLGAPANVDSVMDRFPEALYQQGRDTHLYRFLSALCGDAGAAMIKKSAYASRLRNEAELINFSDLDAMYTDHFRFRRLADEVYSLDPTTDALTVDEWDDIQAKDQSYRSRMLDFFAATRLGNSPEGMRYASKSATGADIDIIEHYRYIFDQYSDDPLGEIAAGKTLSVSEFVVVPRVISTNGVGDDTTYQATFHPSFTFTAPTLNATVSPTTVTVKLAVTPGVTNLFTYKLKPSYEHNLINILDRLSPVGSLATISEEQSRYTPVTAVVKASSERIQVTRYVNGRADVNWPSLDKTGNFFIQAGVENEAGSNWGGARDLPVVFHTVETIYAYTNDALVDPTYNTSTFHGDTTGIASYFKYRSESIGSFLTILVSIYPFLATAPSDELFSANQALAIHNTPLVLEASA